MRAPPVMAACGWPRSMCSHAVNVTVTQIGSVGALISGAVAVEAVFWPGLGTYAVQAILSATTRRCCRHAGGRRECGGECRGGCGGAIDPRVAEAPVTALRHIFRDPVAAFGLLIVVFALLVAIFAP